MGRATGPLPPSVMTLISVQQTMSKTKKTVGPSPQRVQPDVPVDLQNVPFLPSLNKRTGSTSHLQLLYQ